MVTVENQLEKSLDLGIVSVLVGWFLFRKKERELYDACEGHSVYRMNHFRRGNQSSGRLTTVPESPYGFLHLHGAHVVASKRSGGW